MHNPLRFSKLNTEKYKMTVTYSKKVAPDVMSDILFAHQCFYFYILAQLLLRGE